MKLKQIISILVICQLVIVPTNIAWGKGYCDDSNEEGYTTDAPEGYKLEDDFIDQKSDCDDQSTHCWKTSTNTCQKNITRIESQDTLRDAYMDGGTSFCDSIDDSDKKATCQEESTKACKDETDDDDRKECMDNFARNYATSLDYNDMGIDGENAGEYTIVAITTIILMISYLTAKGSGIKKIIGPCLDRNIFNITSLAVIAHEVYTYTMVNDEFKTMIEAYEDSAETDAYSTQLAAFEYLQTQQDKVAEVAEIKAIVYGIVAAGYFASAIAAIAYLATHSGTSCTTLDATDAVEDAAEGAGDAVEGAGDAVEGAGDAVEGAGEGAGDIFKEGATIIDETVVKSSPKPRKPIKKPMGLDLNILENANTKFANINQTKDSTDLLFLYEEREGFFSGKTHSPKLSEYNQVKESQFLDTLSKENKQQFELGIKSAIHFTSDISLRLLEYVIPSAHALDFSDKNYDDVYEKLIFGGGGLAVGAIATLSKKLTAGFDSIGSWVIAVAGIVVGGFATHVSIGSNERHEQAEKNSEIIGEIIEDFEASLEGYCSNGHDDISDPRCYCYDDKGDPIANRSNSDTCTALYSRDQAQMNVVDATDYGTTAGSPQGCIRADLANDYNCKCPKMKNASGQNACAQAPGSLVSSFNAIGAGIDIAPGLAYTNNTLSGVHSAGNFNPSTAMNYAAKSKKRAVKMFSQLNNSLKGDDKKQLQNAAKGVPQILKKMIQDPKFKQAVANSAGSYGAAAKPGPSKGRMAKALKKALKKTGLKRKGSRVTYGSRGARSAAKKKGSSFHFDDDVRTGSTSSVQHFQDKKYKYKHNDIVKNEGVSIWKVLTNRYNQSGLRRLFGDE